MFPQRCSTHNYRFIYGITLAVSETRRGQIGANWRWHNLVTSPGNRELETGFRFLPRDSEFIVASVFLFRASIYEMESKRGSRASFFQISGDPQGLEDALFSKGSKRGFDLAANVFRILHHQFFKESSIFFFFKLRNRSDALGSYLSSKNGPLGDFPCTCNALRSSKDCFPEKKRAKEKRHNRSFWQGTTPIVLNQ